MSKLLISALAAGTAAVGKLVIAARAGATQIVVNNNDAAPTSK